MLYSIERVRKAFCEIFWRFQEKFELKLKGGEQSSFYSVDRAEIATQSSSLLTVIAIIAIGKE